MKSKKTKAESAGLVLRIASFLTASLVGSTHARADDTAVVKTPRPLPHMQDIKTPPNNPASIGAAATPRPATAQQRAAVQPKLDTPRVRAPRLDPNEVLFDEPGDGAVWAVGARYKASFGAAGAVYIPFLGSCAPADYPVRFALASVSVGGRSLALDPNAPAQRTGARVAYDRGALVEVYDVRPDSIEQEFEIASNIGAGDLVVRIAIDTGLEFSETSAGFRWANALGAVEYGSARLRDAAGRTTSIASHVSDGAIEIRVPDSLLSESQFPIVIDPVISTFTVDNSTADDTNPDIAFDATNNVYEVVWEQAFSATDHDCYSQLQDAGGTTIAGSAVAIDSSTDYWARPRTANNLIATQFLVVAEVGAPSSARVIKGRTRNASGNGTGSQFQISDPSISDDQFNVSVGGDPSPLSPTYYCVAWQRIFVAGSDNDIFARLVLSNSTLLGTSTIFIDNSSGTLDQLPSVSRSDGNAPANGQDWTIVWQRAASSTNHNIRGAQVHWDGTITNASFSISATASDDTRACASSVIDGNGVSRNYLVVFQRDFTTDHDIMGTLLNGTSVVAAADLSLVENGGFLLQDQIEARVDSDGADFAVSYSELFGTSTTDYDIFISSFNASASGVSLIEAHQSLAGSADPQLLSQITSRHSAGAGGPRYAIVWSDTFGSADHDVYGGLYRTPLVMSYCSPGSAGVIACPCSNPGSAGNGCNNSHGTGGGSLSSSGSSSLSGDTFRLTQSGELPTALSIFLQGNANIPNGITFGDGVRCAGGTLKRLFTHNASSGTVSAPSGTDLSVSLRSAQLGDTLGVGAVRYYQVYYRDPNLVFCPAGFNVGNALQVSWVP